MVYVVKNCALYFSRHIYALISSKDNEYGGDYLLELHLEGKKTLNISITNDENNHFPVGSMVVKGEYLTQDNNARKKGGYVFRDEKSAASAYYFTNLTIGTNL